MSNKILYVILICILCACEKVTDWKRNDNNASLLVVEGMITNEKIRQKIVLSRTVADLNESFEPVTGALVTISTSGEIYNLVEDTSNPGTYYTNQAFQGVINKEYTLLIQLNGLAYTASTYMVPVEPLDTLGLQACNNGYSAVF